MWFHLRALQAKELTQQLIDINRNSLEIKSRSVSDWEQRKMIELASNINP